MKCGMKRIISNIILLQADMTIPSYMLGGKKDKIFMAVTVALTGSLFVANMYYLFQTEKK